MSGEEKPRRLCSEIQLFDLCSKTSCKKKDGRYCTDEALLEKFEAISQEDEFSTDQYMENETEDGGEEDEAYPGFGDDYDEDEDYENES